MFKYFNTTPKINNKRRKTTESESNDILEIKDNHSKDKNDNSTYSMESIEVQLAESVKRTQENFIEKRLKSIKERYKLVNRQKRELDQREIHLDRREQKLKEFDCILEQQKAKLELSVKQLIN